MTKSKQHASSLLLIPKPDNCPSSLNLTRLPTNDVASCSVSSVVKTRMRGVNLTGEEMEMEMGIRWRERKRDVEAQVKGKEEKRVNIKLTAVEGRDEKEMEMEMEMEKKKKKKKKGKEKSVRLDEIWNGVWT